MELVLFSQFRMFLNMSISIGGVPVSKQIALKGLFFGRQSNRLKKLAQSFSMQSRNPRLHTCAVYKIMLVIRAFRSFTKLGQLKALDA